MQLGMILVFPLMVPKGYRGITLFPFIILRRESDKIDKTVVNYERIHLRQQLELLVVPFYLWYLVEFMIKWLRFRNHNIAYRAISFEKEAYAREGDLKYLKHRRIWSFMRYF